MKEKKNRILAQLDNKIMEKEKKGKYYIIMCNYGNIGKEYSKNPHIRT